MDSQFVSILIGIVFVVGVPMLEKLADKIKQEKRRSVTSAPPRRQTQSRPKPIPHEKLERPVGKPAMAMVEGARVTSDNPYTPYSSSQEPQRRANTDPQIDRTPGHSNLKDAVIWSEILNNPKFKEF